MYRKQTHRVSRIRSRRRSAGAVSELYRRGHALLFFDRLQRRCAPGMRLRCPDHFGRYCRLQADGARRRTSHRFLSPGRCCRTGQLPACVSSRHGQAAEDGGAEFLCRPAHDHAQCRTKVHTPFRAAAARANFALRFALPAAAPVDSLEIAAAAIDDAEFARLGTPLHNDSCTVERKCRV